MLAGEIKVLLHDQPSMDPVSSKPLSWDIGVGAGDFHRGEASVTRAD